MAKRPNPGAAFALTADASLASSFSGVTQGGENSKVATALAAACTGSITNGL